MNVMDRRSFLALSARLSALMGLGACATGGIAEGLVKLAGGNAPVLWLEGQCCTGCSVSLLNAEIVTPYRLLTQYISLAFHPTLSAATGGMAIETVNHVIGEGGYLLIVEGSVPLGMPKACMVGEETFGSQLVRAARKAKAVVALGTCAAHGGIPAAENNPTGAVSVPQFFAKEGIATPTIRIPGCPAHPDWLLGTVAHVLQFGLPALDDQGRPKAFLRG